MKIDWDKVWSEFDKWWNTEFVKYRIPQFPENKKKIQSLVESQLKRKKRK